MAFHRGKLLPQEHVGYVLVSASDRDKRRMRKSQSGSEAADPPGLSPEDVEFAHILEGIAEIGAVGDPVALPEPREIGDRPSVVGGESLSVREVRDNFAQRVASFV